MHPSIFGIVLYVWDTFWHLEDSRHGNLPHMTVNSGGDLGAGRWLDRQGHRYCTSTGITPPLRLHSLDSSLHSSQLQNEWNDKNCNNNGTNLWPIPADLRELTAELIGSPADGYTFLWAGLSICSNDITETCAITHRWTRAGCLHTHLYIRLCVHLRPHRKSFIF